jgi:hypothetical protein
MSCLRDNQNEAIWTIPPSPIAETTQTSFLRIYCRLEYILTDRLPQFPLQLFFTPRYLRHESSFTPIKGNVVNHVILAIALNSHEKGQIERHRDRPKVPTCLFRPAACHTIYSVFLVVEAKKSQRQSWSRLIYARWVWKRTYWLASGDTAMTVYWKVVNPIHSCW